MTDAARLLEMLAVIADAANAASSAEEGFRVALEEVCGTTGWPAGGVLAVGPGGDVTDTGTWHAEDQGRAEALRSRSGSDAARGAAASGEPSWADGVCAVPVLAGGEAVVVLEFFTDDGESADPLVLDAMQTVGVVAGRIVERAQAEDRLARLRTELGAQVAALESRAVWVEPGVLRDPVTGLFTPSYLQEALRIETARAERGRRAVTVIALGVDSLPALRQARGDEASDAAIAAVAELLRTKVRKGDLAARYDDEFIIVLPGVSVGMGRVRSQQLRKGAEALAVEGIDPGSTLTASAGFACFPDHGGSEEELMEAARAALHKAQGEGGGRLQMAELSLKRWTRKR